MTARAPRQHDEKHLSFIRSLPCLVCFDNTSTEAAHVRMSDLRAAKVNPGVGAKPDDCWTVPLCSQCHREQHEMGEAKYWDAQMIDPIFIAMALHLHTENHEACEVIIRTCH